MIMKTSKSDEVALWAQPRQDEKCQGKARPRKVNVSTCMYMDKIIVAV